MTADTHIKVNHALEQLRLYCEKENFKGYDPYDGLNSQFFQAIPFLPKNRLPRLVWIQLFKRMPFNLRPIVGIQKDYNPKALGIFLSGYCKLYQTEPNAAYLLKIDFFVKAILNSVSAGRSGACWGYNFDWESKAFYQPKFTPTIVASSFIANALLDAYEITGESQLLDTARSTCNFFLNDLNRTYNEKGEFAFSYSMIDNSVVFNASLLGSRLLARVYYYTREPELMELAKKSVSYCCNFQQPNGAWAYGNYSFHQWIDNFHTGYNLECLQDYATFTGDHSFDTELEKGFEYYINTFFTEEGICRYYSNSVYPIDIHAPTQLVITLAKLNKFGANRKLVDKVVTWAIDHMQDEKGYFYYQINRFFSSKIPYMRWSQSWMFYALAVYMQQYRKQVEIPQTKLHENLV